MFLSHKAKCGHLYYYGQVYVEQKIIFIENCAEIKVSSNLV